MTWKLRIAGALQEAHTATTLLSPTSPSPPLPAPISLNAVRGINDVSLPYINHFVSIFLGQTCMVMSFAPSSSASDPTTRTLMLRWSAFGRIVSCHVVKAGGAGWEWEREEGTTSSVRCCVVLV